MLVFATIVPHPPFLVPALNQKDLTSLKKTRLALEQLAEKLAAVAPETIIIISPHGPLLTGAFSLNIAPELKLDFRTFGDLETQLNFSSDIGLGHQLKEALETKLPIQLISESELDYGIGVPLYCLAKNLKNFKIIPLNYSDLENDKHFELGQKLTDLIQNSKKRIAIIASGDLSHALTNEAPAPYSESGKIFDKNLIKAIEEKDIVGLINLEPALIKNAAECGLKSILILLGILNDFNYQPEIMSYEYPFGVGYLVCNFELNQ